MLIKAILIGIGATITFDLWGLLLKVLFKIKPSDICILGRWVLYMPEGKFAHNNILTEPGKKFECAAGWAAHYLTGIILSIFFIFLAGNEWLAAPLILPAVVYGIISVIAPLFIMQPAFGFGFAGSKTPKPFQTRMRSLMNHTAFGVGLYVFAVLLNLF